MQSFTEAKIGANAAAINVKWHSMPTSAELMLVATWKKSLSTFVGLIYEATSLLLQVLGETFSLANWVMRQTLKAHKESLEYWRAFVGSPPTIQTD